MADKITKEARSANMRAIKNKGMKPEMAVRRIVYGLGHRYRINVKDIAGKPDIAIKKYRKAIFVHGCFWHQHPDPSCSDSRLPKSNLGYWLPKLNRNKERDQVVLQSLKELGWDVLVIWECETKNAEQLTRKLRNFLK